MYHFILEKAFKALILQAHGRTFYYLYDFGDGWEHELVLEKSRYFNPQLRTELACLEGERACPPENGIHAEIRSFHDTAYDGLFQSQYGWGLIRVSEEDFHEAQRIVKEWKDSSPDKLPWENK
ncbi:MAG: IS1096 element passenger TnpR family protein [Thermodesulfobacteriota bacterium]